MVAAPMVKSIGKPEFAVAIAMKAGVPKSLSEMLANMIDWFSDPTTIDWVELAGLNAASPS